MAKNVSVTQKRVEVTCDLRCCAGLTNWNSVAAGSIIVMLTYLTIDNHVDLYPWNNLVSPQLPSTLVAVIPFGFYAAAFASGLRWMMIVGTVHSYVWLALQIRQWWIPYLFGSTWLHSDFEWYFAHGYDRTISMFSRIGDRPVPDAQHLVLQTLSLFVVIATTAAVISHRS